MTSIGNVICLTPQDSYMVDEPIRKKGLLRRLERLTGPFVRSPGVGFPYLIGFLRAKGVLDGGTRVVVQHDRIEGPTPFGEILDEKVAFDRGDHDVLFLTSYTNSIREAYRRAREARAAYAARGKKLTIVLGGAHASAVKDEGTRLEHVDAVVAGEGEWAAAELLDDSRRHDGVKPLYQAAFSRIRVRGALTIDMEIWQNLRPVPQQILASSTLARGCKLDCHFCAVKLTNGPTIRNRDVRDVVDEIRAQGTRFSRDDIGRAGPGFFNTLVKTLVKMPILGRRYGDRFIARLGPGYTQQFFFWDDNLYNAPGSLRALCEAIKPLGRLWGAQLTMDIAEKPDLLRLAYESGCRDLFLGIESVNQSAIDGIDKWSNNTVGMKEKIRRVHDAGIKVMGAFVFGLEGDTPSVFDETLEFIDKTGIDFVVANIIQPYPGTGTFQDAVATRSFLPWADRPADADVAMDYNWPLFDGAHVLIRPKGMSVEQLQEGYYYFLRSTYSLGGIARRFRGEPTDISAAISHFARNYLLSRYGMSKTAHAIRRKKGRPVRRGERAAPAAADEAMVPSPELSASGGRIA
ncbi:MAG: B12-binding domain-containing radical SAM protein [Acidobacteriota bacterium]